MTHLTRFLRFALGAGLIFAAVAFIGSGLLWVYDTLVVIHPLLATGFVVMGLAGFLGVTLGTDP